MSSDAQRGASDSLELVTGFAMPGISAGNQCQLICSSLIITHISSPPRTFCSGPSLEGGCTFYWRSTPLSQSFRKMSPRPTLRHSSSDLRRGKSAIKTKSQTRVQSHQRWHHDNILQALALPILTVAWGRWNVLPVLNTRPCDLY